MECEICECDEPEDDTFIIASGRCRGCKGIEEWIEKNVVVYVKKCEYFSLTVETRFGELELWESKILPGSQKKQEPWFHRKTKRSCPHT